MMKWWRKNLGRIASGLALLAVTALCLIVHGLNRYALYASFGRLWLIGEILLFLLDGIWLIWTVVQNSSDSFRANTIGKYAVSLFLLLAAFFFLLLSDTQWFVIGTALILIVCFVLELCFPPSCPVFSEPVVRRVAAVSAALFFVCMAGVVGVQGRRKAEESLRSHLSYLERITPTVEGCVAGLRQRGEQGEERIDYAVVIEQYDDFNYHFYQPEETFSAELSAFCELLERCNARTAEEHLGMAGKQAVLVRERIPGYEISAVCIVFYPAEDRMVCSVYDDFIGGGLYDSEYRIDGRVVEEFFGL